MALTYGEPYITIDMRNKLKHVKQLYNMTIKSKINCNVCARVCDRSDSHIHVYIII